MSFLDTPERQALLPLDLGGPIESAPTIKECASLPFFTGEGVHRRDPERYRLFCALFFSAGLGQMECCRLLRMSPQTGASIIERELASATADQLREYQIRQARSVVTRTLSAMLEDLSNPEKRAAMNQRDHAQAAKVANEIAQLLAGQPTGRHERTTGEADNRSAMDLLREATQPIQAREITGARVGETVALPPAAADPAPAAVVLAAAPVDLGNREASGVGECESRSGSGGDGAGQGVAMADGACTSVGDTARGANVGSAAKPVARMVGADGGCVAMGEGADVGGGGGSRPRPAPLDDKSVGGGEG
jgi:hypothetical protein